MASLDATMIGMGAIIGAGVFVLTGLAAEITGPAVILVFFLIRGIGMTPDDTETAFMNTFPNKFYSNKRRALL